MNKEFISPLVKKTMNQAARRGGSIHIDIKGTDQYNLRNPNNLNQRMESDLIDNFFQTPEKMLMMP